VATEVVVFFIKHPVKFVLFWLLGKFKGMCCAKDKNASTKPEIDISEVRLSNP